MQLFYIKDRLKQYLKENKISVYRLEQSCGFSKSYLHNLGFKIPIDKINRICEALPRLNREWLIFGRGEMINPNVETFVVDEPLFLDRSSAPVLSKSINSFHVCIRLEGFFNADVNASSENEAILAVKRLMYKISPKKLQEYIGLHETDIKTEILNKNETSSE